MSKKNYQSLSAHLLRSNVGGHYSVMVLTPHGHFIEAAIYPGLSADFLEAYDVKENPPGAPVFETQTVIQLTAKAAPAEKEEQP